MSALTNNWYRCEIDKKLLKSLSRREDKTPLLWFGAHLALLAAFGVGAVLTWGQTAWTWAFIVAYGFVWGWGSSAVHELCHGTPFRTRWLNETFLFAFGWMGQMEPVAVRWGHAGHHSYTHFDEGDTELSEPNPVGWGRFLSVGLGFRGTITYSWSLLRQAFGVFDAEMRAVIPELEIPKAVRNARVMVALYALFIVWAIVAQSWLPVLLTLGARIIGGPVTGFMHLTQHTGLRMNIRDHRESTRSFQAGPITRFFYFNMNHHIEHHMFPMVPFYNLPKLNAALKDQLPEPCKGLTGVFGEVLPAIARQYREPGYHIPRSVPAAPSSNSSGMPRVAA